MEVRIAVESLFKIEPLVQNNEVPTRCLAEPRAVAVILSQPPLAFASVQEAIETVFQEWTDELFGKLSKESHAYRGR
jgi:hypothetical protein